MALLHGALDWRSIGVQRGLHCYSRSEVLNAQRIMNNMLKVQSCILFTCIIAAWLFVLPIYLFACLCGSFWLLCALPFSYAASRRLVNNPAVFKKNHPLRQLLAAVQWHSWFSAVPVVEDFGSSIACCHPHGLLSLGTLSMLHFVPGSRTVLAVAPVLFYIPIIGLLGPYLGLVPASKRGLQAVLKSERTLLILPGGVAEIVCTEAEECTMFIQRRMGLFKLAFEAGRDLQIVLIDGEENLYRPLRIPFLKQRIWLSWATNLPFMLPWFGGYYNTFIPRSISLQAKLLARVEVSKANTFFDMKNMYEKQLQHYKLI